MAPDRAILLVLLALISSLIQSCQSIPEEIIVQEDDKGSELNQELFEHLVRSKREAVNNDEKLDVSNLAIPTKLNSSHLHLMVHWAGQGSPVVFILARTVKMDLIGSSSMIFMSKDYGKTFNDISDRFQLQDTKSSNKTNALIVKFYHHPKSNCHYVFADVINKHIFTSEDCGETIKPYNLDTITPSLISFESNNNNIFLVHDLEAKEKRLWVTKNFGETFSTVQEYVRNFFFHDNKLLC